MEGGTFAAAGGAVDAAAVAAPAEALDFFRDFFLGPSPPFFPVPPSPTAVPWADATEAPESARGRFALAFEPPFLLLEVALFVSVSFASFLSSDFSSDPFAAVAAAAASSCIVANLPLLELNSASFRNTIFCKINNVSASFRTPSYKSHDLFVAIGSFGTCNSSNMAPICFNVLLFKPECPSTEGGNNRPDWRYGVPGVGTGAVSAKEALTSERV
mmetsp:Transcript_21644/g.35510  ORF Transcript_21644/g.35510 Transcript_21644/m.35510 type:complete len:215 (-) Transcript_21644:632-1276(-)